MVKSVKRYYSTELSKITAGRFKEYLRDSHILYETSECGNEIHFECFMSEAEMAKANEFIDARCLA